MDLPGKDNTPKRKHYESLVTQVSALEGLTKLPESVTYAKELIQTDKEYATPGMLRHIETVFWELRATKAFDEHISYLELKTYLDLMEMKLTPIEVKLVMQLDTAFRDQYFKENQA